jgi:conjugative transposon TraN protein
MLWLSMSLLANSNANGQSTMDYQIDVSYNKTTSLIFPFGITTVDRGSRDILAKKVYGVENVLQLKAGQKDFPETNLTVITADGKLHHFTVNYSEKTSRQTITISDMDGVNDTELVLAKDAFNARQINMLCDEVISEAVSTVRREKRHDMIMTLRSLHVSGDFFLYRVHLRNKSAINYDIKSLKFYIRDKKKVKRTSSQELEAVPLFIQNGNERVEGYGSTEMVFVLKKFTIPDGKVVHLDLFEQGGGRNLKLKLSNSDILKAELVKGSYNQLTINK